MNKRDVVMAKLNYQLLLSEEKKAIEENKSVLQAFNYLKLHISDNPIYIYIETYVEDADYNVSYNSYFARYSVYMDLESSRLVEIPVSLREDFENENLVIFLSNNPKEACKKALELRRQYLIGTLNEEENAYKKVLENYKNKH